MTEFFSEVCPRCGNLRAVCSDPDTPFYPQRSICYATAAKDVAWRRIRKALKQPQHDDPSPHLTDGWDVWASQHDLTPDDDFEGALAVLPGQLPGDDTQGDHGH